MIIRKIPWTRQPQSPAPINWSSPLLKNAEFILVGSNRIYNPTRVVIVNNGISVVSPTLNGVGLRVAQTENEGYVSSAPTGGTSPWTLACLVLPVTLPTSTASANGNALAGMCEEPGHAVHDRSLLYSNTTQLWRGYLYDVSVEKYAISTAVATVGRLDTVIVSANDSTLICDVKGYPAVSTAVSSSGYNGYVSAEFNLGRAGNTASGQTLVPLFIKTNAFWDAATRKLFFDNPWQIFAPQKRNIYVSVAGGGAITADASITQAGNTSSSTAVLSILADASITASGDTASSTALISIVADATIAESGDTVASVSVLSIIADASITSASDTSTSAAALSIAAGASISQASDTSTANGTLVIAADTSATQNDNTLSATAALVADTITANASITQADNTASADTSISIVAGVSATQDGNTTTSALILLLSADANITHAGDTVASTAALASDTITANADITQADNATTSGGALSIAAGASITQDGNSIIFDSALTLAAYADITQAWNAITSAASSNTWAGDTVTFTSAVRISIIATSAIRKQINFTSAI